MQRTTENIHALSAGARLRDYRVERVLGSGGFGITYRAREEITERSVAIKEYLPSSLAARDRDGSTVRPISENTRPDYEWGLKRFREEAKLLIGLRHPNIIAVLSYFEANSTGYLVMEFQDGKSLGDVLRERKTLAEPELTALVLPLLAGVEAVHAHGFLHRDIKPDNIFIRSDGSPVLLDFGAARQALGQHTRSLTAILTEGYAPYEQYERDGNQGPWTDIHALGAVLFRCLIGERPIDAPKRVAARMREDPDPLAPDFARLATLCAPPLASAIKAALGVTERDRPQTVAELRDIVQGKRAAAKITVPAPAYTLTPDSAEPSASTIMPAAAETPQAPALEARSSSATTVKARSSRWPLYAGLAALLVTGSAAAAFFAFDGGPSAPDKGAASIRATPVSAEGEEAKRRAEEDTRKKADEDARKKTQEEARRKAEEDRKRLEDERVREEARRRAEEDAKRRAEEDAKRRAEEDARRRAEEDARRRAEEDAKRRAEDDAKRRTDEERRKAEEKRADPDGDAKRKAEEDARRKAEEDARRRAEDDARRKAEEEARRKADAEAKQKQLVVGNSWYAPERRQGALFFGYKKSSLEPGALAALERLAGALAARPEARIVLAASADGSEGEAAERQALSRARLSAVQQWLAAKGVAATRLRMNVGGSRGEGPEFRVISVSLDEAPAGRDAGGDQAFRGTWSGVVTSSNVVVLRIDDARGGTLFGAMSGWGTTYTLGAGPPNAVNAQGRYSGNAITITSAHGTFELQLQGNSLRGLFKSSFSSTYYLGRGGTFTVEFTRR